MKKFSIQLLIMILAVLIFSGCSVVPQGDDTDTKETTNSNIANTEETSSDSIEVKESPISDFVYKKTENGTVRIIGYTGSDKEVYIPEKIDGIDVSEIGQYAFSKNEHIEYVKIPDSVTELKVGCFSECPVLKTVEMSDSLKILRAEVFANSTSLENIILPEGIERASSRVFAGCISLKSINIPANFFSEYTDRVFIDSGVETVTFSDGVTMITSHAFANTNIRQVTIPSSVKIISYGAFGGCKLLESVTLEEGVTTIEHAAFGGKSKLSEIIIPKTVREIDRYAFSGCDTIKSVRFEGDAPIDYMGHDDYDPVDTNYTVYYHEGAEGFTSPEWCGYPCKTW